MSRAAMIVVPIVAVLAIVALGVGVYSLTSQPSTGQLQSDVTQLKQQVKTLQGHLSTDNTQLVALKTATENVATTNNLVALQHGLAKLRLCVPQIQQQINSMSVQESSQNGWLTDAYLTNPTVISNDCQRTLYGPSNGTGG